MRIRRKKRAEHTTPARFLKTDHLGKSKTKMKASFAVFVSDVRKAHQRGEKPARLKARDRLTGVSGTIPLPMPSYPLASKIRHSETEVLAIHCGDYRFQSAFQEFLNHTLNLDGNYDLMVMPGGPLSLTLFDYLPKFKWASWKWVRFFAEIHKIRRLILIQHQDCGFYKTMPVHLHASAEPRARQEQDLRRVKEAMKQDLPQIEVELYYAGWDETEHVVIDSITP